MLKNIYSVTFNEHYNIPRVLLVLSDSDATALHVKA